MEKIKYMGTSGSGQLTKIINQICIAGLKRFIRVYLFYEADT